MDVRRDDLRDVRVEAARRVALEVRHARDEARPEAQQVEDAALRPGPGAQRRDREVRHERDPVGVALGGDQLAQLVVRLEAAQQPAERVVVGVLLEPRPRAEQCRRAGHERPEEPRPGRVAAEQRPPYRRQPNQALEREGRERRARAGRVQPEEQHGRLWRLDGGAPGRRDLDGAQVLSRLVEARADEVEGEAGEDKLERGLAELGVGAVLSAFFEAAAAAAAAGAAGEEERRGRRGGGGERGHAVSHEPPSPVLRGRRAGSKPAELVQSGGEDGEERGVPERDGGAAVFFVCVCRRVVKSEAPGVSSQPFPPSRSSVLSLFKIQTLLSALTGAASASSRDSAR